LTFKSEWFENKNVVGLSGEKSTQLSKNKKIEKKTFSKKVELNSKRLFYYFYKSCQGFAFTNKQLMFKPCGDFQTTRDPVL
jgi:hypothetical protein